MLGDNLVVFGGRTGTEHNLNDIQMLKMDGNTWNPVDVVENQVNLLFLDGISFHTMTVITDMKKKYTNIYMDPKEKFAFHDKPNRIKEEGVYIFGGLNGSGECYEGLTVLKIGQKPVSFIQPETAGTGPCGRFGHVSFHYKDINMFVVFGGRNDALFESTNSCCLNDLWLLELENLIWIQAKIHGFPVSPRYSHAATLYRSEIVIFGGISEGELIGGNVQVLETNQTEAYRLHREKIQMAALNIVQSEKSKRPSVKKENGDGIVIKVNGTMLQIRKEFHPKQKEHLTSKKNQEHELCSYLPVPDLENFDESKSRMHRIHTFLEGSPKNNFKWKTLTKKSPTSTTLRPIDHFPTINY